MLVQQLLRALVSHCCKVDETQHCFGATSPWHVVLRMRHRLPLPFKPVFGVLRSAVHATVHGHGPGGTSLLGGNSRRAFGDVVAVAAWAA